MRFDGDYKTVAIAFVSTTNNNNIYKGKNMNNLTNNLNKQLFTELAPAESAAINGGGEVYRDPIFPLNDKTTTTSKFKVGAGSDLKLSTFTSTPALSNNSGFYAELQNKTTGENFRKWVDIGDKTTYWTGLTGGDNTEYLLEFRDGEGDIDGRAVASSGNY